MPDSARRRLRLHALRTVLPAHDQLRVLLPDPSAHVEPWRRQLGLIIQQASETNRALQIQAAEPDIGRATRTRLLALAASVADQAGDVRSFSSLRSEAHCRREKASGCRAARRLHQLPVPDWAWSNGHDEENDRSLAAIRRSPGAAILGRTLVLGAGGCRLAYDLHVHDGGTESAVVDIDPYLLVIAEAIIRGLPSSLTETSVNAPEVDPGEPSLGARRRPPARSARRCSTSSWRTARSRRSRTRASTPS